MAAAVECSGGGAHLPSMTSAAAASGPIDSRSGRWDGHRVDRAPATSERTAAPGPARPLPDLHATLSAGGAPAVLALQRTAGNRAVGALLRARLLARCGAGGCTCGGRCRGHEEEELGPLAPRRVLARQSPGAEAAPASPPPGVPAEKWSELAEGSYRRLGDHRRADAIRACRLHGGDACARLLTIQEVHALLAVAKAAGGDRAKVEEGIETSPLLSFLVPARPARAVLGRGVAGVAGAGAALVVGALIVAGTQLQELAEFEESLTAMDYVILDSPQAVACQTCHTSTPPAPAPEPMFDPDWVGVTADWLRDLEPQGGSGRPQPQPQPAPAPAPAAVPAPAPNPPRTRHPDQICDDDVYDRLRAVVVDCKSRSFSCTDEAERRALGITTRKRFNELPDSQKWSCDEIRRRLQDAEECDRARKEFQTTCFGANTDAGHDRAMGDFAEAANICRAKFKQRGCT
jgi:hypothetical protein